MVDQEAERPFELAAGWCALGAGAIHGAVTAQHFAEWWGYGLFFLAATLAQVVLGLLLLTRAVNPQDSGPGWRGVRRRVWRAGVVGNAAIIAVYLVSRTTGVPWFGPEAGAVEPIGVLDAVSKALEAAAIACLVAALRREPPAP